MANQVVSTEDPLYSPRWSIPYTHVPNSFRDPSIYYETAVERGALYGPILDTVYEMADQLATSNGIKIEDAIDDVCRTEKFDVLPKYRRLLALIWHQPDGYNRIEAKINANHLFRIGTQRGEAWFEIEVAAHSRRSAARLARENGYRVNDVNMVG